MTDEAKVCACQDCTCTVEDGQDYCSSDCADGHPNGAGCGHPGCNCSG